MMRSMKLNNAYLAMIFLLLPSLVLAANLSRQFEELEDLYERGELSELSENLYESKATNDEERALKTYLGALLKKDRADTINLLQQTIDRFPKTHYSQLSLLERAKIHILLRETEEAEAKLKRITSTQIRERYYWLGICAEAKDDHGRTISYCENYLRLDPKGKYVEEAYYLIAGAYEAQRKYQSGITTLRKLQSLKGYPTNEQQFYYRLGTLYKLAENPQEALRVFRQGFEMDRNSEAAFLIEDGIFELRQKFGSLVDVSFLYPYTQMDIPSFPGQCVPEPHPGPPADLTSPVKLNAKPTGGYFVQAGRFSNEDNASRLSLSIRDLNLAAGYFADDARPDTPWVVVCGPFTRTDAESARQTLLNNSIDCFITRF
jgi:tetratricopeptide (TPR) repeat protein